MDRKLDFKKLLKEYYNPQKSSFHIVTVPVIKFLMIDGVGNPNITPEYQAAVETLYAMSYGVKFALKSQGFDYFVPPLEGLWWMDDMREFSVKNKHRWMWTMMIMQPEPVTDDLVSRVKENLRKKKKLPAIDKVRFETYDEGLAVQILYTGAYSDEGPTIAEMHRYIRDNGYETNGKHHEVYLGDPRKTSADRLKTIIRQSIRRI
jgi:hypothetical protein